MNLTLIYFGIVSPGMLAAEGPAYGSQTGHTAGTGPYTLAEWNADHIILRPNPDYWGAIPETDLEFPVK